MPLPRPTTVITWIRGETLYGGQFAGSSSGLQDLPDGLALSGGLGATTFGPRYWKQTAPAASQLDTTPRLRQPVARTDLPWQSIAVAVSQAAQERTIR
jgi:hypothetical protein